MSGSEPTEEGQELMEALALTLVRSYRLGPGLHGNSVLCWPDGTPLVPSLAREWSNEALLSGIAYLLGAALGLGLQVDRAQGEDEPADVAEWFDIYAMSAGVQTTTLDKLGTQEADR